MTLVLDAGGLIAYERADKVVRAFIDDAQRRGRPIVTHSCVVAQVWRGGGRQVRLARLLRGVDERELTRDAARRVGALLAASGTTDVADAAVVDVAGIGDEILTSDPEDIHRLAVAGGLSVTITPV